MNIGFGMIGRDRDRGRKGELRWNVFRPSVALGRQKDIIFDKLVLVYQPGSETLLETIINDIKTGLEDRTIIEYKKIEFPDPFNYQSSFEILVEIIKSITPSQDTRLYLHISTGTHIMQLAMYTIAENQFFYPVNVALLQTYPEPHIVEKYGKDINYRDACRAREIDIKEIKYPKPVEAEKEKLFDKDYVNILLADTSNTDVRNMINKLIHLGKTNEPILLIGATGTGKTRIAQYIHEIWAEEVKKPTAPFMDINCAGLSDELAWSLIFGHVKDAFTGATKLHAGIMEKADGGTLFLDEIGELSSRVQTMLLKAIETKAYYRLGAPDIKLSSTFRLICATNKNLTREIRDGKFREDLYARIRSWEFHLLGLKERRNDIDSQIDVELVKWSEDKKAERRSPIRFGKKARKLYLSFAISDEALWTGNFRDLGQSIRRMAILSSMAKYGISNEIDEDLVREEINYLKSTWQSDADVKPISDMELFDSICNHINNIYPNNSLMSALEKYMQNMALKKYKTKADVTRLLYDIPGSKPHGNPSDKFSKRQAIITKCMKDLKL